MPTESAPTQTRLSGDFSQGISPNVNVSRDIQWPPKVARHRRILALPNAVQSPPIAYRLSRLAYKNSSQGNYIYEIWDFWVIVISIFKECPDFVGDIWPWHKIVR